MLVVVVVSKTDHTVLELWSKTIMYKNEKSIMDGTTQRYWMTKQPDIDNI